MKQNSQIKSFIMLYILEMSLHVSNTAPFVEMSQRWQAVRNNALNFTGPRFELQTYRSEGERVTARPTRAGERKSKQTQIFFVNTKNTL